MDCVVEEEAPVFQESNFHLVQIVMVMNYLLEHLLDLVLSMSRSTTTPTITITKRHCLEDATKKLSSSPQHMDTLISFVRFLRIPFLSSMAPVNGSPRSVLRVKRGFSMLYNYSLSIILLSLFRRWRLWKRARTALLISWPS